MDKYNTEQEQFWAGDFGNEYASRNIGAELLAANIAFFSRIFHHTDSVKTVMEFGANIGMNIRAIMRLLPNAKYAAIEINKSAVEELYKINDLDVTQGSIIQFTPKNLYDFVFIKGVLIHIAPEYLEDVYANLYKSTKKYICLAEYYNPSPVTITYRGHENKLFKRDFAGEMLDKYKDLRLVDYGFAYHRDNNYPQDDITWFLLEKM